MSADRFYVSGFVTSEALEGPMGLDTVRKAQDLMILAADRKGYEPTGVGTMVFSREKDGATIEMEFRLRRTS